MLKALTTLAALAASLFVFAGLAQAAAPADRPDPTAVAAALVGSPAAQVYVVTLRPHLDPSHRDASDLSLVTAAVVTCQGFDAGLTFQMIGGIAMASGFSPYEAGAIAGASVAAFCPQYAADLT